MSYLEKLELEQKLKQAQKEIDRLYSLNGQPIEQRIREIATLQHKMACWKTRIDIYKGIKNYNVHLEPDLRWTPET